VTEFKAKILSVEDDESIQEVIKAYLEVNDYEVYTAASGPEGLALFSNVRPDVVILDINLPGIDGMELAARIRKQSDAYILMLTARGEEMDRIAGLKLGADDYVVKPFSARELVARVDALLRRKRTTSEADAAELTTSTGVNLLQFPSLTLDLDSYEATADGKPLDVTTKEFTLIKMFMEHHNQVLSRDQILNLVWGSSDFHNGRIVDVYVGQVRRKLEEATGKRLITTVRGVGYRFQDKG
jgi:two-component system alkaline phosphatase synthesis response regulator PhoP